MRLMPKSPSLRAPARLALALAASVSLGAGSAAAGELERLQRTAAQVTIVRDDWGIAHVHGRTDAQAVFGMIYAQAEDDFPRVEANYITSLGRKAEVEGEGAIWEDLRQRLFVDPVDLRRRYAGSPASLRALMVAWADGLNFFLATHPGVKPRLIRRFEPWMALSFSEGSIGGDIAKVSTADLESFYGAKRVAARTDAEALAFKEPAGSNGAAIGPRASRSGHALLLINPHTSFFFRSELQMTSDEGLNAYGAATWGQFFIYQGFNPHAGWMHTTSSADVVDEFAETIVRGGGALRYRYGAELRPVTQGVVVLRYRTPMGGVAERRFSVPRTHHGPVVRATPDGRWVTVSLMNRPVEALRQSFERTRAVDLASFLRVAELAANSSNNTLFADDRGETALLPPQFVPRRDPRFDYTRPVDGSDPATDWRGVTSFAQLPHVVSPRGGWIYNSNDGPWWAAGDESPRRADYPAYVDPLGENARTPHAVEVFGARKDFDLQLLIDAAYDPHLPLFERLIPRLAEAHDRSGQPELREPVAALRAWDRRWSAASTPTALAVFWAEALWARVAPEASAAGVPTLEYMQTRATGEELLAALGAAVDRLHRTFGDWRTPWGEINRFQRLDANIASHFDDAAPSVAVPFTSAQWGSLASFGAKAYANTRRYYGTSGNSFVAAVEFGPRVRARAVTAGGESGDPSSRHFRDQASRYAAGDLREVYFHPDQLVGHTERTYHPGG